MPQKPRSLEEEEAKLKPNSYKAAAFHALRAAGPGGLTVPEIIAAAKEGGHKSDWGDSSDRALRSVCA